MLPCTKNHLILFRRCLFCISVLSIILSFSFNDIYLNSYITFFFLSLCTFVSLIFLRVCNKIYLIPLDFAVIFLIIIQAVKLIINNEMVIYYQSLLKFLVLSLWMVSVRNLCRNDLKRTLKCIYNIFSFILFLVILFLLKDRFSLYRFYNSVVFTIFISTLICFLILYDLHYRCSYFSKITAITLLILNLAFAIYFSSRTSFVIIIITLFFLIKSRYSINLSNLLIAPILVGIILYISFTFKIDSSFGRLFIWKNSLSILGDNWIDGVGLGRFPRVFMEYQQTLVKNLSFDNKYFLLAGNTSFAYNDVLEFMCKLGVLPFVILISSFLYSYYRPIRNKQIVNKVLVILFISSLLNYILQVIYFQLIMIVLISSLNYPLQKYRYKCKNLFIISFILFILVGCSVLFYFKYKSYKNITSEIPLEYSSFSLFLSDNPDYLWKYANSNFLNHNYSATISALNIVEHYAKNYDSEYLYAKTYNELGQYRLTEQHLINSINMYPSKYACRYELFLLYKKMQRYDDAAKVAKEIIDMPQKIPTGLSFFIIESAKNYIEEYESRYNIYK